MRLPHEGTLEPRELQAYCGRAREWADQYVFTWEPFAASHLEVFDWYVSASPRSPWTTPA